MDGELTVHSDFLDIENNMPELSVDAVRCAIEGYPDPETGRPIGKMNQIVDIQVADQQAKIKLGLTSHSIALAEEVTQAIESKVVAACPGANVAVDIVHHPRPAARNGQTGMRVKSVILVGSGKGGVGKSTVATSIALTLGQLGAKVGLLDADVYGPSVPQLLGLSGRPNVSENQRFEPIRSGTMPVISMGFLIDPDQAVIWRGPMLHRSINQFLSETEWGELDYLIVDMPPGTGDVALSLSQAVPIAGAVVVCTPQQVALLDAIKAISMFRKVNIPILGMVENMSGFLCPDNGKTYDIFGSGGAQEKARELDVPYLGGLPIDIKLRVAGDEGRLAQVLTEDPQARAPLDAVTKALVRNLASQSAKAPSKPSLPTL